MIEAKPDCLAAAINPLEKIMGFVFYLIMCFLPYLIFTVGSGDDFLLWQTEEKIAAGIISLLFSTFAFKNFKAPVKGLFAGDETVIPNGASDIMHYAGRENAPGCAYFPMYLSKKNVN